jgi:predicted 3-demethylubiquinone-9 3-methyltransferase (glyoxalase superfamily)
MQKITPFLWFDGKAEEATLFYVSIFKNSRVKSINRQGKDGPVFSTTFNLDGQDFFALNGGPRFTFSPAISFFVNCESQAEVDDLWDKLTEGGSEEPCGWLKDKYGMSWQIIPSSLGRLLSGGGDAARAGRVLQAMLQMAKLDVATLQRAFDGN